MDLLLLSGGIDSASVAAWRRPERAIVVDYGQRPAEGEVRASLAIGRYLGIKVDVVRANCAETGMGMLAGQEPSLLADAPEWWPFRNQLIVTIAAAWGVARGVSRLLIGTVRSDGSRHADATPFFVEKLDQLLRTQEGQMQLAAPAIQLSSAELIELSGISDAVLGWTHSCHIAVVGCGACPGCAKRRDVFSQLNRLS